jgi:hypothetical protein
MTISFLRILSGLTGFVLLAMPASAAARDHRGPTYQAPPHATGQPVAVRVAPPVTVRAASFVETHRSRPAHASATYNPPPRYTQPPMHVLPPREHLGRPATQSRYRPPPLCSRCLGGRLRRGGPIQITTKTRRRGRANGNNAWRQRCSRRINGDRTGVDSR